MQATRTFLHGLTQQMMKHERLSVLYYYKALWRSQHVKCTGPNIQCLPSRGWLQLDKREMCLLSAIHSSELILWGEKFAKPAAVILYNDIMEGGVNGSAHCRQPNRTENKKKNIIKSFSTTLNCPVKCLHAF